MDELDVLFQALAHRVRRCIISVLGREGGKGYAELMKACGIDDSGTFAFHLRRLRGLVVKDEDSGVYVLTGLGRRAFDILEFLEGRGSGGGSSGEAIVLRDRVRLVLGEDHLRRARRAGRRIIVRDVGELVIERVPADLFDQVVESIRDVSVVRAPVELRAVVDSKVRDVYRVVYYGDGVGGDVGVWGAVAGVVRLLARGFMRGFARREVSSSEVFEGGRLVVEVSGCSLVFEPSSGSRVVGLWVRGVGVDAGVSRLDGGVRVWCRAGGARGRVRVPGGLVESLVLRVDAGSVELGEELAVSSLDARVDAGVVRGMVSFRGEGPRAVLEGSAAAVRLDLGFSGGWSGSALVSGRFDSSSVVLGLVLGRGVGVEVDSVRGHGVSFSLVAGGVSRGLPYREDGERVVRVLLEGSASSVKVSVERVGSS